MNHIDFCLVSLLRSFRHIYAIEFCVLGAFEDEAKIE